MPACWHVELELSNWICLQVHFSVPYSPTVKHAYKQTQMKGVALDAGKAVGI